MKTWCGVQLKVSIYPSHSKTGDPGYIRVAEMGMTGRNCSENNSKTIKRDIIV